MMKFGFTAEDFKDNEEFVQNLVDGKASFTVTKYTEGTSQKSGVPMVTIDFDVMQNGKKGKVRDFITEKSRFKFILLAKAAGDNDLKMKIKNDENILDSDVVGKCGEFIIEINGNYANVGKYLPKSDSTPEAAEEPPAFDDDIPF